MTPVQEKQLKAACAEAVAALGAKNGAEMIRAGRIRAQKVLNAMGEIDWSSTEKHALYLSALDMAERWEL